MTEDRVKALHIMDDRENSNDPGRADYNDDFLEFMYGPILDALLDHPTLLRRMMKTRKLEAVAAATDPVERAEALEEFQHELIMDSDDV